MTEAVSPQAVQERFGALPVEAQLIVVQLIDLLGSRNVSSNSAPVNMREAEAAEWLSVKANTLARWRVEGSGPPYRKHGRVVIYALVDLEAWSRGQARGSTSEIVGA